jgi:hypothetical protein
MRRTRQLLLTPLLFLMVSCSGAPPESTDPPSDQSSTADQKTVCKSTNAPGSVDTGRACWCDADCKEGGTVCDTPAQYPEGVTPGYRACVRTVGGYCSWGGDCQKGLDCTLRTSMDTQFCGG